MKKSEINIANPEILKALNRWEKVKKDASKNIEILCNIIAKYSPIKKGDKVLYLEWYDDGEPTKKGIVETVRYSTEESFIYYVKPAKNDWTIAERRYSVVISDRKERTANIKKVEA